MTRPQDAALASEIGASYIGVVFADGPRRVSPSQGREILDAGGSKVRRVGVFGTNSPDEIARASEAACLDVVQLHADPTPSEVRSIRKNFRGEVWAAIRIAGHHIPVDAEGLFDTADAVVLDARSEKRLGGTGQALPWSDVAVDLARDRGSSVVVLAGGLKPDNVGSAIRTLAPDVVDVSSGVESAPGIKDPWLMREFFAAATGLRPH
ncbi:MAG TPA: phosphoribosylanthranilate isomerase [Gemmatimonadaceae bacterium]|jgi:phosphoribosylanthranilate isomerase|nr:phosphoribosylanthranilate isomerase [Gemmatimonadaceae bacterium]